MSGTTRKKRSTKKQVERTKFVRDAPDDNDMWMTEQLEVYPYIAFIRETGYGWHTMPFRNLSRAQAYQKRYNAVIEQFTLLARIPA